MNEILTREAPFELVRADNTGDGLTLTGYAAVFNTPTRIDSWEGKFDEQLVKGAFRKTLQERTPVLQFDHGHHPLVGSIPIGSINTLREDRNGLYVEARLHDNWVVQPVRDAIDSGSITGMSFRFQVVKEIWDESNDIPMRTLKEVRLFELGPVVFPAYEATSVGVRSVEIAQALTDPTTRAEVARLLISGTPNTEPPTGTREEAATTDPDETVEVVDEPQARTRRSTAQRRQMARRAVLQERFP